jgi:hypothetical protein
VENKIGQTTATDTPNSLSENTANDVANKAADGEAAADAADAAITPAADHFVVIPAATPLVVNPSVAFSKLKVNISHLFLSCVFFLLSPQSVCVHSFFRHLVRSLC